MAASYGTDSNFEAPYDLKNNTNDVVNNTDGSIVGYKYFNFTDVASGTPLFKGQEAKLLLNLTPLGVDGTIEIWADRPWASQQGMLLGKIELKAGMRQEPTELTAVLPDLAKLEYKHAIFFKFKSSTKEKSLCTLHDFVFTR